MDPAPPFAIVTAKEFFTALAIVVVTVAAFAIDPTWRIFL
jgi:hypothetical protein